MKKIKSIVLTTILGLGLTIMPSSSSAYDVTCYGVYTTGLFAHTTIVFCLTCASVSKVKSYDDQGTCPAPQQ